MLEVGEARLRPGILLLLIWKLSGALDSDVHIFGADVVKSFDTAILSIMPELDSDSSFLVAWWKPGLGVVGFLRVAL